jgi:hypothetical protein
MLMPSEPSAAWLDVLMWSSQVHDSADGGHVMWVLVTHFSALLCII